MAVCICLSTVRLLMSVCASRQTVDRAVQSTAVDRVALHCNSS